MNGVDNKSGVNNVCYRLNYVCIWEISKTTFKSKDCLKAILTVCCIDQRPAIGIL